MQACAFKDSWLQPDCRTTLLAQASPATVMTALADLITKPYCEALATASHRQALTGFSGSLSMPQSWSTAAVALSTGCIMHTLHTALHMAGHKKQSQHREQYDLHAWPPLWFWSIFWWLSKTPSAKCAAHTVCAALAQQHIGKRVSHTQHTWVIARVCYPSGLVSFGSVRAFALHLVMYTSKQERTWPRSLAAPG
jgi:hypothetical protein